jgi:Mg2+ and Co2+ transporter CorA
MIDLKSKTAILILIILNIMGIVINLPIETGTPSSYFNFIFSLFYLLVWIGLGIYFYTKKELIIYIYMLGYWVMVMGVSIEDLIITRLNAQVAVALSKFSIISILFDVIFVTPLYGLNVVFKLPFKEWFFSVILISVIFIILWILAISAINSTRKKKKL